MSKRLNQEREQKLQPERIKSAKAEIERLGFVIQFEDNTSLKFQYLGNLITFFPYSGWFSGKGVKDGRGLKNLLEQISPN
mgnify:FL=1